MKTKNYFFRTTTLISCFILFTVNTSFAQNVIAEWLTLNSASTQPTWNQKLDANNVLLYYYHAPTAKSSNNQNAEFRFIDVPNIAQVITPKTNAINKPPVSGSLLSDGTYFKYSLLFTNNFAPDDYYSTIISTEGFTNITVNSYLFGAITNASDPTKMMLQYVIGGGNPVDVSTYSLPTKNIAYEFTASLPQSCEGLTSLELRWVVKSYAGGATMSNVGMATSITGTGGPTTVLQPVEAPTIIINGSELLVTSKKTKELRIYNVQGQIVESVKLNAGITERVNLKKGIYIISGKKIVI